MELAAEFENDLADAEFESAVERLYFEFFDEYETRNAATGGDTRFEGETSQALLDGVLPGLRELESGLDGIGAEAGDRDLFELPEAEIDRLFSAHRPAGHRYGDKAYFFEATWDQMRRTTRAANRRGPTGRARGAGVRGQVLAKVMKVLKGLVGQLIARAVELVRGSVPEPLQGALDKLRKRLSDGGASATTAGGVEGTEGIEGGAPSEPPAGADALSLVEEWAGEATSSVLGWEVMEDRTRTEGFEPLRLSEGLPIAGELGEARRRLVDGLRDLKPGEDPTALMENFVPVVMTALRVAKRFLPRKLIVDRLGRMIGQLVAKLIGPEQAPALGTVLADRGLKLLGFEVAPDGARYSAVASPGSGSLPELAAQVVESSLVHFADSLERYGLAPADLESDELLEVLVREAVEQGIGDNFPPTLLRPDLRQSEAAQATWVPMPSGATTKFYKKGGSFRLTLKPEVADSIETFGGQTLGQQLYSALGLPRVALEVIVHLFELLPIGTLSHIAFHEKKIPGLGSATADAWNRIHYLSTAAATALLGDPRLGRPVAARTLESRHRVAAGARFYVVEVVRPVAGSSAVTGAAVPPGEPESIRPSPPRSPCACPVAATDDFRITIDCQDPRVVVDLYLSEANCQRLAAAFRSRRPQGELLQLVLTLVAPVTQSPRGFSSKIRVVPRSQPMSREARGAAATILQGIVGDLTKLIVRSLVQVIKRESDAFKRRFVEATEADSEGVTIRLTASEMPGMSAICKVAGGLPQGGRIEIGNPKVVWDVQPGRRFR